MALDLYAHGAGASSREIAMDAKNEHSAAQLLPNLADLTRQMQAVQLDAQVAMRPLLKGGALVGEVASDQIVHAVRALAKAFLKRNPGATPKEFVTELRNGRAPSAAWPNDTDLSVQQALAEMIVDDPSLLDLI